MSVNDESQSLVVREMTDLMYNTDHLQEDMVDCWVLVFALDDKQSFGIKNVLMNFYHKAKSILIFSVIWKSPHFRFDLLDPGLHEREQPAEEEGRDRGGEQVRPREAERGHHPAGYRAGCQVSCQVH